MEHPAEHLEHVEHQQHAAHHPFDRKVAMSMAILASMLAAVTLLSHRAHNETILEKAKASNQWAFYQAKNIRNHEYKAYGLLLDGISPQARNEDGVKKAREEWDGQLAKYKTELPAMMEEAKAYDAASEHAHHRAARFDLGELGLQLSLILCSIAILTKRTPFWYGGLVAGVTGIVVAVLGFFVQH